MARHPSRRINLGMVADLLRAHDDPAVDRDCRRGFFSIHALTNSDPPDPRRLQGPRPKDQVLAVVLTVSPIACPRATSWERTTGGAVPGSDPNGGGMLRGWRGPAR